MYDKNDKDKNFLWTTDYKVELPIIRKSEGWGSIDPSTICKTFEKRSIEAGNLKALSDKVNG